MNTSTKFFSLISLWAFLPPVVSAHHSVAGTFDTSRITETEGVVTSVLWGNPHVRIGVAVSNEDGQLEQWDIEMTSLTTLRRRGVADLRLEVGDAVKVAGNPAKDGSNQMYIRHLLSPNRSEIVFGNDGPRWSEQALGTTGPGFGSEGDSSRPDLGMFRVWSTPINGGGLGNFWNSSYPLTAQAKAAVAAFNPATDAPTLNCLPKGMPTIMGQPYPMQIIERDGNIVLLLEEYDTVRTIYMGANVPAPTGPRPLGLSLGRWDGETLIAETTGINWPHFDTRGTPLGDAAKTVETFSVQEDGARLNYTMTVTDPATFTEPVELEKSWLWLSAMTIEPFDCTN
jgi:hypothetical protein